MTHRRGRTTLRVLEISAAWLDPLAFGRVLPKGDYGEWGGAGVD